MQDIEVWKDVHGYEGMYHVSSFGRVKRVNKFKSKSCFIMKLCVHHTGYINIRLSKNGVKKNLMAHRMIALSFIPNPQNKPQVNHKNGIKTDNRVENLEWATISENAKHAFNLGLSKIKNHG